MQVYDGLMRCENCKHTIKRVYTWNNQSLGIECWKKIALPEIERQRVEKFNQWKKSQYQKNYALVQALKQKDLSKIHSEFTLKFIPSIITQFESAGFISKSQMDIINGKNSTFGGMLNQKDKLNKIIAFYLISSDISDKNWAMYMIETLYDSPKNIAYFEECTGDKFIRGC